MSEYTIEQIRIDKYHKYNNIWDMKNALLQSSSGSRLSEATDWYTFTKSVMNLLLREIWS